MAVSILAKEQTESSQSREMQMVMAMEMALTGCWLKKEEGL
jgi:hypothetical protein